ncbi:MAG: hypothetical protein JXA89_25285 [Anaerolineae bacterium]|nr:hypothetical protein [Anaerolineae bacterium]
MVFIRVVVAARDLEAGTKLSPADVEVVQVHAGAVLEGAFKTVEDVTGLVITVQRMLGDQVTADMISNAVQNALAQAPDSGLRAVAIDVERTFDLSGLLRSGDTISAIGIIERAILLSFLPLDHTTQQVGDAGFACFQQQGDQCGDERSIDGELENDR